MDYTIERLHIEQLILSCFINQLKTNELDQMELREYKLPYKLFKANRTNLLTAKAIFNLQEESKPIDDLLILCYIEKHTSINEVEWLELNSTLWATFDTMITYLDYLKELDQEEIKEKRLKAIR